MSNLVTIQTLKELEQLSEYIKDKEFIAVDTETTGLDKDAKIIGVSISAEPNIGYYIILSYWDVPTQQLLDLETKDAIKSFIEQLTTKSLIMHNGVFDCHKIELNYGISLINSLHTDTMILGQLLDENRHSGLKELGAAIFGNEIKKEKLDMEASIKANGGSTTKASYELYKADKELIALYGAQDAVLTYNLWVVLTEELYAQGLEDFFYKDESMPLLRGPTYELNTVGLRVDADSLQKLKNTLEAENIELKAYIYKEIEKDIKTKYPATNAKNTFNIGSSQQLGWLLFGQLGQEFNTLTDAGKEVCKFLGLKLPYSPAAKREFIRECTTNLGRVYVPAKLDLKTGKTSRPKTIGEPWKYIACGGPALAKYAKKFKWVEKHLLMAKNKKLLSTYIKNIQELSRYNIIQPSFLQHGTTSGRYSSRHPNFQNLPRDDKRVKGCLISRPGKIFVGADYSQLEPRIFASVSGDERLCKCFAVGDDVYSLVGVETFNKEGYSLKKEDLNSFAKKFPDLRQLSKEDIMLASTYGTTAYKMSSSTGLSKEYCQETIDSYFNKFPKVHKLMLDSHEMIMTEGKISNLFGRVRRIPEALEIKKHPIYKNKKHSDMPYEYRNMLNQAVNHRVQSTGASVMNRAAIACHNMIQTLSENDSVWQEVKIVLQVHDELILEGPEALKDDMAAILKYTMESTTILPGVDLIAEPKIAYNIADLK